MPGARVLHYEIVRPLGRGGMGEVVEALDTRLGRRVALKFVADELPADPSHLTRFEREARAAGGLSHPNIAIVHAFEVDDGRPFLVMELLAGPTLRALVSSGPLPLAQALRIARETAAALAFAHGRREPVVHRDLKPENLMFDAHGATKLMDFGLAHAANAVRLTRTDTTLGTPGYMAPEAIAGKSEAASDMFALGVILYEMLTGQLPFEGENAMALMYAITNQPPKPLLEARPDAGEGVGALVAGLLEKSPKARPTAEQTVRSIDELLGTPVGSHVSPDAPTQSLPALDDALVANTTRTEDLPVERAANVVEAGPARPPAQGMWARFLPLAVFILLVAVGFVAWRLSRERAVANHAAALATSDEGTQALLAHDLATAEARFRAALRLDPRLLPARIGLAAVATERGDRSDAAAQFTRLLADIPNDEHALRATAWSHLAEIAIADGNWADAIVNLRRAFVEDSSEAMAYNQLGFALINTGAADSARALLERGIRRFPSVAPLHKNAGLAALAVNDLAAAAAGAEAALAADPGYAPGWALLARVLARRGDKAGATTDLKRYLDSGHADSLELAETTRDLVAHGVAVPQRRGD